MQLTKIMNNFHVLTIGAHELYFSYETLIAIAHKEVAMVSENIWSQTTGKHINYLKREGFQIIDNQSLQQYSDEIQGVLISEY